MDLKLKELLNKQITEELFSSYLYLAMAADFESKNLNGMAAWMKKQSGEETGHGMKIYKYLLERGEKPVLGQLDKPQDSWATPTAAFEAALKHEKHITGCINDLFKAARTVNDPATEIFLQWFVSEQVEEEASVNDVLARLEMVSGSHNGLYMLDKELGQRS